VQYIAMRNVAIKDMAASVLREETVVHRDGTLVYQG